MDWSSDVCSSDLNGGAHATVVILLLARLGEVVALQGRQHIADADDVAGQVRGDDVTQRRDVPRLQILELATGTTGLAVVGANLQFHDHGQAKIGRASRRERVGKYV